MLLVDCPICGHRELRGVRSIERLVHTDAGIVLTVTCRACNHRIHLSPGATDSAQDARPDRQAS